MPDNAQFQPAAVPLIVRSPYFSSWVAPNAPANWPQFWGGNRTLGWGGFIRVDGSVYEWMGIAFNDGGLKFNLTAGQDKAAAKVDGITITPTRTIYSLSAGPMRFNFTFLSPIEPQDLTLQSFPFGYVYVDATSGDGNTHSVQVYSDLSGEWLSEDSGDTVSWDTTSTNSMVFHSAQRMPTDKLADTYMAHDGILYHATLASSGMTWQTGGHYALRAWFLTQGSLNETRDNNIRKINDAKARAEALDDKILSEARDVSPNYANLVSLSARQTFGGVETAVSSNGGALMFMKDVGTTGRVNPVETIYASFPAFLYINATWGRYLLEPLLQYQQSSLYANNYAAPDLGADYPIAQGGSANLLRSIEDSGSMLIMAWAHARFSGDQSLLNTYYDTLKKWSDYLISANAFASSGYQDADGLTATNLTNLALKGIIGVRAMAEISHTLGRGDDTDKYQNQAATWIKDWEQSANVNGHLVSSYNSGGSWGMIYNLFADKLLGMNLVSKDVSKRLECFRRDATDQMRNRYMIPKIDSISAWRNQDQCVLIVDVDWTMLTAATSNDVSARESLLRGVYEKAVDNTFTPFPSTYNTQDGKGVTGLASPAQGAAFGLLSMNIKSQLAGLSGNTSSGNENKSNAGAIAGGVVGGLAGLALIVFGFLFWRRRKNNNQARDLHDKEGGLATFFGGGRNRTNAHVDGEGPLADYHVEPMTMPIPPGNQSQRSQHSPYQDYPQAGTYYSTSSNSDPSRGQSVQLSPLRLHNGDNAEYYGSASSMTSGEERRPQAAPLPRKGDLAPLRRGPPSAEEIRNHTGSAPTSVPSEGNTSDTSALRNEVEHLRREMEEMRSRTMYEPPPSYT
ncbi:hypothetical protein VNI00_011862 [Paramarasmius palmivorus]|uniref:DUF1793-domain-containing protein n=1 Tax=Paramarasmius palmivorus TaxID=297713 RepID=A0AAW0C9W5_9AGAR